ncbi:MAG TPA: hypothetical protein PLG33_09740 [Prolixibacteraceae bacterium]|nr:hypothetical protein [Prolixibacteraceae bacterium]
MNKQANDRIQILKKYLKKVFEFCVFIALIFLMIKWEDYSHKKFLEKYKKAKFEGQIIKKYIDRKQHNYQMLVIQKKEGRDSTYYDTDSSGFWDFVEIGDSVIKIENSNEIKVVNKDTSFFISF